MGRRSSAPADTCVAPVLTVPELVADAQFVARGAFVDAAPPRARHVPTGRPGARGHGTDPTEPYVARDATVTDTDALLDRRGPRRPTSCATLHEAGVIA